MPNILRDCAAAVAIEMAAAIGFLTVSLLALVEVGVMQVQYRQGDHGYAVFSDLIQTHQGDMTCAQVGAYFDIAFTAFLAGNPAASDTMIETGANNNAGSDEFRLRLAGVRVGREDDEFVARVQWHARMAGATHFQLGDEVILPDELLIDNQFYLILQGRTHVVPVFTFLTGGRDQVFGRDIDEQIFLPRYSGSIEIIGPETSWCEHDA